MAGDGARDMIGEGDADYNGHRRTYELGVLGMRLKQDMRLRIGPGNGAGPGNNTKVGHREA